MMSMTRDFIVVTFIAVPSTLSVTVLYAAIAMPPATASTNSSAATRIRRIGDGVWCSLVSTFNASFPDLSNNSGNNPLTQQRGLSAPPVRSQDGNEPAYIRQLQRHALTGLLTSGGQSVGATGVGRGDSREFLSGTIQQFGQRSDSVGQAIRFVGSATVGMWGQKRRIGFHQQLPGRNQRNGIPQRTGVAEADRAGQADQP